MINFTGRADDRRLSASALPSPDDDGEVMQARPAYDDDYANDPLNGREPLHGPDALSSFEGITLQAYLTPGPYSQREAARLLAAIEMLRDLVTERTVGEDDDVDLRKVTSKSEAAE